VTPVVGRDPGRGRDRGGLDPAHLVARAPTVEAQCGPCRSAAGIGPAPFDEAPQPFGEVDLGLVAGERLELVDIGEGGGDVAGLHRPHDLLGLGDSTVTGAVSVPTVNKWRQSSASHQLGPLLAAKGIPALSVDNAFGSDGSGVTTLPIGLYDDRVTGVGASVSKANIGVLGGEVIQITTIGDKAQFQTAGATDTVDIYYIGQFGATNVLAGASVVGAINSAGGASANVRKATITYSSLTDAVIEVALTSGSSFFIVGIDAYLSSAKTMRVLNLGWSGSSVGQWTATTQAYSAFPNIPVVGGDHDASSSSVARRAL